MAKPHITTQVGDKFNRWTVISDSFFVRNQRVVQCRCDCGTEKPVRLGRLHKGESRSCGCLQVEELTTHGHTANAIRKDSNEYWIWNSMRQRAINPKHKQYADYGGRGIGLCERWLKFENFYADMGPRPSKGHSIERKENDKGYEPSNCRWATRTEQNQNKRNNRFITANGETLCLAEWARRLNCINSTILGRIKMGWSEEKAVTVPVRKMLADR
jgi:hypothetical protein